MTQLRPQTSTPHKICQDDFSPGRGNALQAAVASIFGLDLKKVPNFIEMPEGYEAAIQKFCQEGGSDCIKIALQTSDNDSSALERYNGNLCILRGKSPRGDFGHVVVAKRVGDGFEMMHDPHPDGTFLDEGEKFGWCMFFA
mmetsp:Transcript_17114/g.25398  ORF Transcript_17114/g.25398 Transcript_17114/m.25398 type:complete len:141 (-) Transcript_17114:464-886(-)